jgi:hypothetical protein
MYATYSGPSTFVSCMLLILINNAITLASLNLYMHIEFILYLTDLIIHSAQLTKVSESLSKNTIAEGMPIFRSLSLRYRTLLSFV